MFTPLAPDMFSDAFSSLFALHHRRMIAASAFTTGCIAATNPDDFSRLHADYLQGMVADYSDFFAMLGAPAVVPEPVEAAPVVAPVEAPEPLAMAA